MPHQASSTQGDIPVEQYLTPPLKALKHLESIKEQLLVNMTSDITHQTLNHIIAQLHETSKLFRTLPDSIFPTSKDALLKKMQLAIIELHIARDQLDAKGRTRRFYTCLLASIEYLECARAQQENISVLPTEKPPQKTSLAPLQPDSTHSSSKYFFTQFQHLRDEMTEIQKVLSPLYSPDHYLIVHTNQWTTIHNPLQAFCKTLCQACSLLDHSIHLPIAQSAHYPRLVTILYAMAEQVQDLIALMNAHSSLRNKSSKRAIAIRQNMQYLLEELLQKCGDAVCHIAHLLDQLRFPPYSTHRQNVVLANTLPE